ncbi:MAG: prepilin-type N-terminal cleavage/methylation domain-containing protein [Nitrospirae bacterium]|nr:prepilin-type N-terminal cleavage/methylation domain-containing protein [Nitrospirota bacterium]
MKKDLNQKGFTLIELSIVLVIIGIILGAVLKGQDLLESAKAKKLSSTLNAWNALTWTYMDRMGRFPGDVSGNGVIGDVAATEQTTAGSAIGELTALNATSNAPLNPVAIGGQSFWVYLGYDAPGGINRNVMVICVTATCAAGAAGAFTADQVRIIQSVDTAIDGAADGGLGQVRAATAVSLAGAGTTATGRAAAAVIAVTGVNETAAGVATAWASGGTQRAAVWLFDKPY